VYLDGRSGRAAFEAGHLPGAVWADVDRDLAAPASATGGRHPLPEPAAFAEAMTRLGIGDRTPVVAYDDSGGAQAARLWWMLSVLDHPVAVLDGGIDAWSGPTTTDEPAAPPAGTSFTARPWPDERTVTADQAASLASSGGVVLDARAADRYRGEANPIDPRFGHVPGARSAPFAGNLGPDRRFLPPDVLRTRYADLGADGPGVVAYCGSGVTACHDLLAREVAGLPAGRLFVGSWSAWAADPDRPVATGDAP
jgi:thiosulfate/3-mercaptopyruvate sulfurtransferase